MSVVLTVAVTVMNVVDVVTVLHGFVSAVFTVDVVVVLMSIARHGSSFRKRSIFNRFPF